MPKARGGSERGTFEHDPEKAGPALDAGGYRFSEKIVLQQKSGRA